MDFLPTSPRDIPKGTYECLTVVTIGGNPPSGRRGSSASAEEDTGLARVLSGGRRRSAAGLPGTNGAAPDKLSPPDGTWYWRARVGITGDSLVIMPVSEPPNPILKQRPAQVIHGHIRKGSGSSPEKPAVGSGGGFMNAIRRASAGFIHKPEGQQHAPAPNDEAIAEDITEATPTAAPAAPAAQAANGHQQDDNANRETGWPAVVDGGALRSIVVPLHNITKDSVRIENKKTDFTVSASINSAIAGKWGILRFEFDRDWLGSKGEAELLHDKLQTAVETATPLFTTVKLSGKPGADAEYDPKWQGNVRGKW